jgi:hypothetical protein
MHDISTDLNIPHLVRHRESLRQFVVYRISGRGRLILGPARTRRATKGIGSALIHFHKIRAIS